MTVAYSQWNSRLFSFFFNKTNEGKLVLCSVDSALLNSIGKDLGGFSGFIESVIGAKNINFNLPNIMHEYRENPTAINFVDGLQPPDYFSLICFTILAWTVDPELHAGNYYRRLDSLIIKGLSCFQDPVDCNSFTLSNNHNLQNDFRENLRYIFNKLESYMNISSGKRYGFIKLPANPADYVNIPKSQLLVRACDLITIQKAFYEARITPVTSMPDEAMLKFIRSHYKSMFSSPTIAFWEFISKGALGETAELKLEAKELEALICSYIQRIKTDWDGEEPDEQKVRNNTSSVFGGLIPKQRASGIKLVPCLSVTGFSTKKVFLNIRILITDSVKYSFPLKITIDGNNIEVEEDAGGFSKNLNLELDILENLFLRSTTNRITIDKELRILFEYSDTIAFAASSYINGYTPVNFLTEESIYVLKKIQAVDPSLMPTEYSPIIEEWNLFRISSSTFSLLGGTIAACNNPKIEILGGFRVNPYKNAQYLLSSPPSFRVTPLTYSNSKLQCLFEGREYEMSASSNSSNIYEIPKVLLREGEYTVFLNFEPLQDSTKSSSSQIITLVDDSLTILDPSSFDGEKPIRNSSNNYIYEKDIQVMVTQPKNLLNQSEPLEISEENFPLKLEINCYSDALAATFDQHTITNFNKHNTASTFELPRVEGGEYTLRLFWHRLELKNYPIKVKAIPKVTYKIVGTIPCKAESSHSYIVYDKKNFLLVLTILYYPMVTTEIEYAGNRLRTITTSDKDIIQAFKPEGSGVLKVTQGDKSIYEEKFEFEYTTDLEILIFDNLGNSIVNKQQYETASIPEILVGMPKGKNNLLRVLNCYIGETKLIKSLDEKNACVFSAGNLNFETGKEYRINFDINGFKREIRSLPIIKLL